MGTNGNEDLYPGTVSKEDFAGATVAWSAYCRNALPMTVILKCAMAARVAAAAAVAAASAPRRATLSSVRTADLRQSNSLSAALRRSKSHNCAAQALSCLPLRMSCARVLSQQRKVATLASSLTTDAPTSQGDSDEPKRVVFLGTPQVGCHGLPPLLALVSELRRACMN